MRLFVMISLCIMSAAHYAVAEPMPEADIPVRFNNWHISYDINADGSYVETQKYVATILKENAIEREKRGEITFSTSVAKGEILEAYTIKKSGQRIDAPKNSYQVTINDGYDKASPLFSDETTISVIFPDVAVGDSVVLSYRITNREGIFPGQFSASHYFSRYTAYDDVTIEISAPTTMKLKTRSYFLKEDKPLIKNGKQSWRWSYQNRIPEKWEPGDRALTEIGDDPSLYVSTFNNYREISDAYGVRANPKAAVTERVKKLASEVAGDKTSPEAQARILYEWVAKNISYGGNCIGIGAVVPRDLDVVLDNKMGDCKDHATLLQALLAAKNIDSEQALINAGSLYDLPDIPVVSSVNHVINYIPGLKLFVDSTSSATPFGMLPDSLGEKPVLLVTHYREGMKTPSTAQYGHEQVMQVTLHVNPNGSAKGTLDLKLKGIPGVIARAAWRNFRPDLEEYTIKRMLEAQGTHGTGKITKDDPTALIDSYNYSLHFDLEDFIPVGTATGMPVRPAAATFMPIEGFLLNAYAPLPKKRHRCMGGASVEEYLLEFPESVKILSIPKDVSLSGPIIDYRATYRKNNNSLAVRRELKDKTPSNLCSPEFAAEYRKIMQAIAKDVKSQILIGE